MIRFKSFKAFVLLAGLVLLSGCKAVEFVDLPRYMGTWYQISANPFVFSDGLVGVTATYSLNEDDSVTVVNRGFKGSFDGEEDVIEGSATVFDPRSNSSLIVTFPGAPQFRIPNYLIVVLDEVDYQYAAVTDPFENTLFILSRNPQMDEGLYQAILSQLAAKEIDISRLVLTPQQSEV